MNAIDITTRSVHRFPTMASISALALIFAAVVALGAESNATDGGVLGLIGDYIAQVGEALGAG